MDIEQKIKNLKAQIAQICAKVGRNAHEIQVVAASKYASPDQIRKAYHAGIKIFGENKVQDLKVKQNNLQDLRITFDFIGHLQSNKTKDVVGLVRLIHSLDTFKLAKEINKQAQKINCSQEVLIQVNISGEVSKYGILPQEAESFYEDANKLKFLDVVGLMTMAPLSGNPEVSRVVFKNLKRLADKLQMSNKNGKIRYLSMGMSTDYKVAIEEGANIIRIGSLIFN